jgi:hypothetical protein
VPFAGQEGKKVSVLVKKRLLEQLDALPDEMQYRVLDFAEALLLTLPKGVPGAQLLKFTGTIPASDLQLMREAIESGCERVDDEW